MTSRWWRQIKKAFPIRSSWSDSDRRSRARRSAKCGRTSPLPGEPGTKILSNNRGESRDRLRSVSVSLSMSAAMLPYFVAPIVRSLASHMNTESISARFSTMRCCQTFVRLTRNTIFVRLRRWQFASNRQKWHRLIARPYRLSPKHRGRRLVVVASASSTSYSSWFSHVYLIFFFTFYRFVRFLKVAFM